VPALTFALTVWPATGGGSACDRIALPVAPATGPEATAQVTTSAPIHGLREPRTGPTIKRAAPWVKTKRCRLDQLRWARATRAVSVAPMPFLIVRSGPRSGERIELAGELIVGRENADVTVDDEEVSRRHLAVRPHDDGVELEDLGSTNGTFVDGARLASTVVISESARVVLGETELEIEVEVPEPEVDPGATRLRERPVMPDATIVRPVPEAPPPAERTIVEAPSPRAAPAPPPERAAPPPPERAPAPPPPPAPATPARPAAAAAAGQPFGSFTPAAPERRRGGPATRLWAPATIVFIIIIATAVALVIYFAAR
jgi:hypothetical protein